MNTAFLTERPSARPAKSRRPPPHPATAVRFRSATPDEAVALHKLIAAHAEEGHLLPRTVDELTVRALRFVVAVSGRQIVGCAELAPLSPRVAEIRSLVVDRGSRALGIGRALVDVLRHRAERDGFKKLCAFTHDARFFLRLGFDIVPHASVPEKIAQDCRSCALFGHCGQYAVEVTLGA
jgi:amino-acid N-acetyltransferase